MPGSEISRCYADEEERSMVLESLLEHQHTAQFWHHINTILHIPGVESGRAALESFLAVFARGIIVEIEVQREIRTFLAIWRFVCAIAMCFG